MMVCIVYMQVDVCAFALSEEEPATSVDLQDYCSRCAVLRMTGVSALRCDD